MDGAFANCTSLTGINNNNLFNHDGKIFANMFNNCTNLTSVDESVKLPSTMSNCQGMFANCINLNSINLNTFIPSEFPSGSINISNMFNGCTNITGEFPIKRFYPSGIQLEATDCVKGCTRIDKL